MAPPPAEAAPAAEEQTEFTATLTEIGPNKIPVIKVVRELTGLGLKEAKDLVDATPKAVKEGITRDEAEKIKAALEEQGAQGRDQVVASRTAPGRRCRPSAPGSSTDRRQVRDLPVGASVRLAQVRRSARTLAAASRRRF